MKDYAAAIELKLDPEDVKAIREIGEEAYMYERDGVRQILVRDCITLEEWNEPPSGSESDSESESESE